MHMCTLEEKSRCTTENLCAPKSFCMLYIKDHAFHTLYGIYYGIPAGTACAMLHATCEIMPVKCYMPHATCEIMPAKHCQVICKKEKHRQAGGQHCNQLTSFEAVVYVLASVKILQVHKCTLEANSRCTADFCGCTSAPVHPVFRSLPRKRTDINYTESGWNGLVESVVFLLSFVEFKINRVLHLLTGKLHPNVEQC